MAFPVSNHEIVSYDAHPLFQSNSMSVLINCNGKVSFAEGIFKKFNQVFVLTKQDTQCISHLTQMLLVAMFFVLCNFHLFQWNLIKTRESVGALFYQAFYQQKVYLNLIKEYEKTFLGDRL
jgi:hypothetical protein